MPITRDRKMGNKRFKSRFDRPKVANIRFKTPQVDRDTTHLEPWPRRLLHVPSMTSYTRQSGNRYKGIKEPTYNAISYTWGRFEDNSELPINIGGVTWKIPGIRKSHFTTSEFQKAIETAAGHYHFIWLDIACIDQENEAIKMDEVNNQAAIYRRAHNVYAWMVPWTTSEMLKAFHTIFTYVESIGCGGHCKLAPLDLEVEIDLDSLAMTFQNIIQQGWFTSLWTLQEGFLRRPDFLSKSSDSVYYHPFFEGLCIESKFPIGITFIAANCRDIWDELRSNPDPRAVSICQSITDTGLIAMYFYKEPYLLYPAALQRYVSLPQDAVYAIMHVFGLRMPTMDDVNGLLLRLAIVLIQRNPVASQIFIHQEPVGRADAWRMSKSTHMPFKLFIEASMKSFCTIEGYPKRRPEFTGKMTTLENIALCWTKVQQQRTGTLKTPYRPDIYLDATPSSSCVCLELESDPPVAEDSDMGRQDDRYTQKMPLQDLSTALPFPLPSYRVLLLGSWHSSPRNRKTAFVFSHTYEIGLIVRQGEIGEKKPCYRVGFCAWLTWLRKDPPDVNVLGDPDSIEIPSNIWQETQCLIG